MNGNSIIVVISFEMNIPIVMKIDIDGASEFVIFNIQIIPAKAFNWNTSFQFFISLCVVCNAYTRILRAKRYHFDTCSDHKNSTKP